MTTLLFLLLWRHEFRHCETSESLRLKQCMTVKHSSVRPSARIVMASAAFAITTVNGAKHIVDCSIALVPPHLTRGLYPRDNMPFTSRRTVGWRALPLVHLRIQTHSRHEGAFRAQHTRLCIDAGCRWSSSAWKCAQKRPVSWHNRPF